jgi:putative phage-type endonuclease
MTEAEVTIEQGSPAWHAWRSEGIGASLIPAIMNESEYDTPLSLWRRLTGREVAKENNFAMTVGLDNEGKARAIYEIQTGTDCPPVLMAHQELTWARASLDGWNEERKLVVEIKCMGKEKHQMARDGKVPETYRGQLQWQLLVSDAKAVHFVSLNPETMSDIEIVAVTPDPDYWERMIKVATNFWAMVQSDTPPPLTADDFMEEVDEATGVSLENWKRVKLISLQLEELIEHATDELIKKTMITDRRALKDQIESARAEIQKAMKHPKLKYAGVKVITKKTGTLDIRLEDAS